MTCRDGVTDTTGKYQTGLFEEVNSQIGCWQHHAACHKHITARAQPQLEAGSLAFGS